MSKPDHLSHSSRQLGKCPKAFKEIRIDGKYKRTSLPLTMGAMIHDIVYEYSRSCINMKIEADYDLMSNIINEQFGKAKLDTDLLPNVWKPCMNYAESHFQRHKLLEFEKEFRIDMGRSEKGTPVIMEGKIDRINLEAWPEGTVLSIIDFKNQANILTEADVKDDPQLMGYVYTCCNHLYREKNIDLVRRGIYFVRYNYMVWDRPAPIPIGALTSEFDAYMGMVFMDWDRLIDTDKYEPEPGDHCFKYEGCPVMRDGKCPIWTKEKIKEYEKANDPAALIRLARHHRDAIKQSVDKAKKILEDTQIEVDGIPVGWKVNESYSYDMDKIIILAVNNKIDLAGLTIGKTETERAIKKTIGGGKRGWKLEEMDQGLYKGMESCRVQKVSRSFKY